MDAYRLQTNGIAPIYGGTLPNGSTTSNLSFRTNINEVYTDSNTDYYIQPEPYNSYDVDPAATVAAVSAYAEDGFVYPHMFGDEERRLQNKYVLGTPEEVGNYNNFWDNLGENQKKNLLDLAYNSEQTKIYNRVITNVNDQIKNGQLKPLNSYEPINLDKLYSHGSDFVDNVQPRLDTFIRNAEAATRLKQYYINNPHYIDPCPDENGLRGQVDNIVGQSTIRTIEMNKNLQKKWGLESVEQAMGTNIGNNGRIANKGVIDAVMNNTTNRATNRRLILQNTHQDKFRNVVQRDPIVEQVYQSNIDAKKMPNKQLISDPNKIRLSEITNAINKIDGMKPKLINRLINFYSYDNSKSRITNELGLVTYLCDFMRAVNAKQRPKEFATILTKLIDEGTIPINSLNILAQEAPSQAHKLDKMASVLIAEANKQNLPQADREAILAFIKTIDKDKKGSELFSMKKGEQPINMAVNSFSNIKPKQINPINISDTSYAGNKGFAGSINPSFSVAKSNNYTSTKFNNPVLRKSYGQPSVVH